MTEWISVEDDRKPIDGECVLVIYRSSLGRLAYGLKYYYADRFNPWDNWGGYQILCWISLPPIPEMPGGENNGD